MHLACVSQTVSFLPKLIQNLQPRFLSNTLSILVLVMQLYLGPQLAYRGGQTHRNRNERHLRGSVMESTLLICHLVGTLRAAAKQSLIRLPWKEPWFGAREAEIWCAAIPASFYFCYRFLCRVQRKDNSCCLTAYSSFLSIKNLFCPLTVQMTYSR